MDVPAPVEAARQGPAAVDRTADKAEPQSFDKRPPLQVVDDSKQQPGQLSSPASNLSPRCSACSSATALAMGSPCESAGSSMKEVAAAGHFRPPWNTGTKAVSVSKLYADAVSSPTSSPRWTSNPASPRLRAATCTSTAVAPSSGSPSDLPRYAAIEWETAASAEMCSSSNNQAAKVNVSGAANFGTPNGSVPPARQVTTSPPMSSVRLPDRLVTSSTAAGPAADPGAAATAPSGKSSTAAAISAAGSPRAVAGLLRKPGAVITVTNGRSGSDNQSSAPGTAACNSTASRPGNSTSKGNHSIVSLKATSSNELDSTQPKSGARNQSVRSLKSSSSPNSRKQLQQQLASSSKGSSLKSIHASQAAAGAATSPAVQKPRRSAVEAMLQKQFSTELDFQLKVQQWRGKEADVGATPVVATAESASSEDPAFSLAGLKNKVADTAADFGSQLSAEHVTQPVAAMASADAVDVPATNLANMISHAAAGRSAGGVTPFAVIGLETAGSSDADACCYFSTPRRGERDMFKRQRASIVGETDCTAKPVRSAADKHEQEQQQVLSAADMTEQLLVQHQKLDSLVPATLHQRKVDKSPADGNSSSSRGQSGQQLQESQQHTDSNQQLLLQEQDSAAEVEELQQPMQQRMPSLPLQPQCAGLQSPLHPNAVQQVQQQQQQQPQQEVYGSLTEEPLLNPIEQRRPSLPMLQEEERRSSLLLRLPGSAAGGIDLGMAALHGPGIEPPTPQFAVVQLDLSYQDTIATRVNCLKGSNDGWQPSSLSCFSNDSSEMICSLNGKIPRSVVIPAAGSSGTATAGQQFTQQQQQQQHRSLQYSTSGCVRISTDTAELTTSNVPVSNDFTAAVKNFSRQHSPGLCATSSPCTAATVLPGSMAPAADPAAMLTLITQPRDRTSAAATNRGSSDDGESASTELFDAAARLTTQQEKQQDLAFFDCQASCDSEHIIKSCGSPVVEAVAAYHPARRVSRHSRQVSMDGSAVLGSEAASLAAIAAELEDSRRSSHDSRMIMARPAAAAITNAADTHSDLAADAYSIAADATSTSEAAMAALGVELSQTAKHSMHVSHHSQQVSMAGCNDISWLNPLYSEPAQGAVPKTSVDGCLSAQAADDDDTSSMTLKPSCDSASSTTRAAVPDGSGNTTHVTAPTATTRQTFGLPLSNSVQDVLQQGHSSESAASDDDSTARTDGIVYCADSICSLSTYSSASALTQSNRSAGYQHSVEGDSVKQDIKVIWNQMYDNNLAGGCRDSDTAITRTSSSVANLAADTSAVGIPSVAAASDPAEQVLEVPASLVTISVDSLDVEDSLPPLEAASSLVCLGSSVCSQDPDIRIQEAVAPAVNSSHSIPAAERDADADTAGAASDTSGSPVSKPGGAIALLFEMKQLLQEDVAALRASIDSLGQPSPRVQQQQNQPLQIVTDDDQQHSESVTAAIAVAAMATDEGGDGVVESQHSSMAQAPLPRMQVPHSPSTAGTGIPSIAAHALPMSHTSYVGQTLASRILQQLYPASPSDSGASSGRSSPALAMGNARVTAVGSGRIPNQWGFAAAKLMNALTSTTNSSPVGNTFAAGNNIQTPSETVVLRLAPQAATATVAASPLNETLVVTQSGVRHMVHRTLTSRVRSLLGDAAAGTSSSAAPGPSDLTAVAAHQPGDGVAAMHVDASGLLQLVLQVRLPGSAGNVPLASSAGQ